METAKIIQINKDNIVESWLKRIKKEFPEVKNYDKSAIEDDVPDLLDKLIDILNSENGTDHLKSIGKEHGKQRAKFADYSLVQVIREYHLLQEVLFQEVDNKNSDILNKERNKIIYAINKAIEHSADVFFKLENTKIKRAKEKAEASFAQLKYDDVLRDDFINAISHDLNNPINNIKMIVELIESDKGAISNQKLLKIIKQSTAKAEKLIRDLLDVNLINSGAKLPLDISHCDLLAGVSESVETYQLRYGSERVQFKTSLQQLSIKADCEAIIRAVENLLDNAIKYGDEHKPVVIECQKKDSTVNLNVLNYGNPISLEDQANIFSRFYRISNSKNKGWGIGLSLVKGIAEAHGGKVSVDSTNTGGTIFSIAIPEN